MDPSLDSRPIIVWLRQDLRLVDHPALHAALETCRPILHCYILDDITHGSWSAGSASRWWLHHSLQAFSASLAAKGGHLVLRRGETLRELDTLATEANAHAVYWLRAYEPSQLLLEIKVEKMLSAKGVESRGFGGALLHEPETINTKGGSPFRVFTPFWKTCWQRSVEQPLPPPDGIRSVSIHPSSVTLDELALLLQKPDWSVGLQDGWEPGERGAHRRLQKFIARALVDYDASRDRPDLDGTARLSPYLHFGEISVRQVWHEINVLLQGDSRTAKGGVAFLRELAWREFSAHLLFHFPSLPDKPFRATFDRFPWRNAPSQLRMWQRGLTGYPLVDAGMRQLCHTGWMHNRVRMVVASFLTKHLLIPWQEGEAWFWDMLVDADLANNAASWQWVAGCGADAAPYFRIFNPVLQGQKFDPQGRYVGRWIPELGKLSSRYIQQPWNAPPGILQAAGICLGRDYPNRIVDHSLARARAIEAYAKIRETTQSGRKT